MVGLSVRTRLTAWRNRVIGDPRFQRLALRFPLTRAVARRRAGALFDLVAGFTYSQTLFAGVQSGLLSALADGPLTLDAVARRISVPAAGADRLLRACAALGLVEPLGARWVLGTQGAALLGNRGIAEMIAHHQLLYADLADPLTLLRKGGGGGRLEDFWQYTADPGSGVGERIAPYSALMTASQPLVADRVIEAYDFTRHRRVLDVGGGGGAFLAALREHAPGPELALFDLPAVTRLAADRFAEGQNRAPITVYPGNFLNDPLPPGFDLITLVRIVHDHDDGPALSLLRATHAALPAGGRLLVAEPMAGTRGAEAAGDAYFGMYLLAMGSGRPRTARELCALLKAAGFSRVREAATTLPLTVRVLLADKSSKSV